MGSVTCNSCGFVSFATSEVCRQCGGPLFAASQDAQAWQAQYPPNAYAQANVGGDQSKGMAVFALICGLIGVPALVVCCLLGLLLGENPLPGAMLGMLLFGVSALLGVILGITATIRANKSPLEFGGKGMAVAGVVLGALSLLSVVPIGIISAIAIPNLLASRRAANEGSAIGSLRALVSAQNEYQATIGNGDYGTLQELAEAELLDPQLAGGIKNGYRFKVEVYESSYVLMASPVVYPNTGGRSFYSSETGVIRAADKQGLAADESDPALGDDYGPQQIHADGREAIGIGYAPPVR